MTFSNNCIDEATAAFFAEHKDVFRTKNCLQLKIREVRQKMMVIQSTTDSEKAHSISSSPSAGQSTSAAGASSANMNSKGMDLQPNNNNSQSTVSAYEQYPVSDAASATGSAAKT